MSNDNPRLLVIGSRGFLGAYVARAAAIDFEVIEANRTAEDKVNGVAIDLQDEISVQTAFLVRCPDAVLLLSAIADIDRCEQNPEEAKAVNLRGAEYVANACARRNARLLFTSTAAVFDGRQHGYSEEDPVSPVSVYGETKAMAERSMLALGSSAIVVRLALVLGFAFRPGTNAVMDNLQAKWEAGQSVSLPVFEQRNPIDAGKAAQFMLGLLKNPDASGIFHIGCRDSITRYDLGLKLATRMGYPNQVRPQHETTPGRAPRGPDHFLLTHKLQQTLQIPIPTCDQVIERCFDGLA